MLPEGDRVDRIALHGKALLTLSGAGKNLRLWNAADGSLVWHETRYSTPPPPLDPPMRPAWDAHAEDEAAIAASAAAPFDLLLLGSDGLENVAVRLTF